VTAPLDRAWYRIVRSPPASPFLVYLPAGLLALGWAFARGGGPVAVLGTAAAAALVWSLFEYTLHRGFLHLAGPPWARRVNYRVHGVHHHRPDLVVFPPWVVLPFSLAAWAVAAALLPAPLDAAGWAGFTLGYVWSDFSHYAAHHLAPRTRWGVRRRDLHLSHHFVDPRRGFGLGGPFWDRVFGTEAAPLPEGTDPAALLGRDGGDFDFEADLRASGFRAIACIEAAGR